MSILRHIPIIATLSVGILLGNYNLSAQTHYNSRVSLGVKGGVELSRVFFNPSVRQKLPIGGVAGVGVRYVEESHFGLIAEANFVQRGWEENYENTDYQYRRTINYLEIPVLAHVYFGNRGKFFFNVGPEISFALSESTNSNFDYNNVASIKNHPALKREYSELTTPIQNKIDFGICAGLGGEFNIATKHSVTLEARFYYGIGNIYKSGRRDPFRASNGMTIGITAGYWLRIK